MSDKRRAGTFCWSDLGTTDAAGAKKFYEGLLGWRPFDVPGPTGTYSLMRVGNDDAAAIYAGEPGMPAFWLPYVAVDSADEAAKKAQSLGAKVFKGPFDAGEAGRMAVLVDPAGATFAIWEGKKNPGAVMNVDGGLCWFELHTRDLDRAKGFYTKMFGWTAKGSPEYTEFHLGEAGLGGMMAMRPEEGANTPPSWLAYFQVADVDATVAKAKSLGGKVVAPAMDMPHVGRFAVIADPQGAVSGVFKGSAKH